MAQTNQIGTHKTSVFTENGYTCVVYHSTAVVKFNDREIILNTGGYQTATTKMRMNQASNQFDLGFRVFQKKHQWYIEYKGNIKYFIGEETTLKR
jgi:hypothetical protein